MESSAGVTCRALAMLTCVVAIPLLAMFGAPLSRATKSLLVLSRHAMETVPENRADARPPDPLPGSYGDPPLAVPTPSPILASYQISTPPGHEPPAPVGPDELEIVQLRLQQLGAIYYLLESWGNEGNYRFSCRIAVDEKGGYTRYFEAVAADGLSAMTHVLAEVEGWKSHRSDRVQGGVARGSRFGER